MSLPYLSRRTALAMAASGAALSIAAPALAQRKADVPVDVAELMKPGPLPEVVLGKADAPCTIVEYASMTCPHCAHFHNTVFPILKSKYIDTGKVRFVMREFPLDNLALAGSMLTRCAGGDNSEKVAALVAVLFEKQEDWAFQRTNQIPALFKLAQQAGFTKESFDKCLTDDVLYKKIVEIRDRASKDFGVDSTPTFFINGKKLEAAPTIEEFDKAIGEIVKS